MQLRKTLAVVLPSISETFGLVILECWAAGTLPIATATSGASTLIRHGQNGWLFDLANPEIFCQAVDDTLSKPEQRRQLIANGQALVTDHYNTHTLAGRLKQMYEQLIEKNYALRYS